MKKTIWLLALTKRVCKLNIARRACLWAALGLLSALAFEPPPARAAVTEAWVHRYSNVASNSDDQAVKVVHDAAGDIIVTGSTDDRIHGSDLLTIKYSGADGSVLWQKRYDGPANGDDYAQALAADGSGNVVVAGYSYGTNFNADYYTAKYAVADGALLWEKRYNGPANGDDRVADRHSLALGPNGMVAITGSSDGNFGSANTYDCATVVYRDDVYPIPHVAPHPLRLVNSQHLQSGLSRHGGGVGIRLGGPNDGAGRGSTRGDRDCGGP